METSIIRLRGGPVPPASGSDRRPAGGTVARSLGRCGLLLVLLGALLGATARAQQSVSATSSSDLTRARTTST
ncbi:MAG: hypothetical protein WCQ89_05310, partial [Verrucomicrobiota bacterium]